MTVIPLDPGGRPKRDLIEFAFEECGSAGYEFERTPEEVSAALRRLNMLMAEEPWSSLDFDFPTYGQGSAEDSSGLPDSAFTAVGYELAIRLSGVMGATLTPWQLKAAALAKAQALPVTIPTAYIAPGTPRGSGARGRSIFIVETPEAEA
jgi:hypothetical protein